MDMFIEGGQRKTDKKFIDKRVDMFVVSVLIIIIGLILLIYINNMKCN